MRNKQRAAYLVLFAIIVLLYGFGLAYSIVRVNGWRVSKSREYLEGAKKTDNDTDKLLLFEKAAVLNANEETYTSAGITALKLGNNTLAEKYLARVKTAEGYFQLANAYYNLEKYDLAVDTFQKVISKNKTAEAYLGLGKSYLKMGNFEGARTALEESLKLQTTKEATNLLGLLVEKAGETDPANRAVIVYNALSDLGYPHSAKVVLQKADREGFLNRESLIALAQEQIAAGNYISAYDYLMRAKAFDPYYPQIYQHLVLVAGKLGKAGEAKQYQEFYNRLVF